MDLAHDKCDRLKISKTPYSGAKVCQRVAKLHSLHDSASITCISSVAKRARSLRYQKAKKSHFALLMIMVRVTRRTQNAADVLKTCAGYPLLTPSEGVYELLLPFRSFVLIIMPSDDSPLSSKSSFLKPPNSSLRLVWK